MNPRMDEHEAEDKDKGARALLGNIFGTLFCRHVKHNDFKTLDDQDSIHSDAYSLEHHHSLLKETHEYPAGVSRMILPRVCR